MLSAGTWITPIAMLLCLAMFAAPKAEANCPGLPQSVAVSSSCGESFCNGSPSAKRALVAIFQSLDAIKGGFADFAAEARRFAVSCKIPACESCDERQRYFAAYNAVWRSFSKLKDAESEIDSLKQVLSVDSNTRRCVEHIDGVLIEERKRQDRVKSDDWTPERCRR